MKDLKLSLIIEALDRATEPLRKVGAGLKGVEERVHKLHGAMQKLGMAEFIGGAFLTGGALAAGHAIFDLTDKVAEMGDAALKSAEKTGASVEEMARWSWVAKQLGMDADGLNHAFAMMNVHVGNAIKGQKGEVDALKLVGLGMKEVRALSADPSALFGRIIEGYQAIKNPAAQAVAAQGIFSRSWMEMAPLLKAPRGEIAALMEQLKKAHFVMTTEDAEAAKKFEISKGNMGLAVSVLGMRIGRELIPRLTEVMDKIADWIESLKSEDIDRFTDAVGKLADELPALLPKVENIVDKLVDFADATAKAIDNTNVLKGVLIALATVMSAQVLVAIAGTAWSIGSVGVAALRAVPLIASLIPEIEGLSGAMAAFDLVMDANPVGAIVLAIGALIAVIAAVGFAVYELHDHWDDVVDWWADLWDNMQREMSVIFPWFDEVAGYADYIKDHWKGWGDWWKGVMDSAVKAFSDGWKRMTDAIPPWAKTMLKVGVKVIEAGAIAMAPGLAAGVFAGNALAHNLPARSDPRNRAAHMSTTHLHHLLGRIAASLPADAPSAPAKAAAGASPKFSKDMAPLHSAAAPASATRAAAPQLLGTIFIKAEPGTSVQKVQKSAGVDFAYRGVFPSG
jgi:hypothetical protein